MHIYHLYKGMTSSNIAANEIADKIVSESSRGNIIYIKLYKNFDRYFQWWLQTKINWMGNEYNGVISLLIQ